MTVLDDQILSNLFGEAAESFEVPEGGVTEILRRSKGDHNDNAPELATERDDPDDGNDAHGADPATSPRRRSIGTTIRAHRFMAVAASVLVVVVGVATAGAIVGHSTTGRKSTASTALAPLPTATEHGAASGSTGSTGSTGSAANPSAKSVAPRSTNYTVTNPQAQAPSSAGVSQPTTSTPPPSTAPNGKSSYIEQTGSLTLQVNAHGIASTMTALRDLAGANGGYVASSQTQSTTGVSGLSPNGSITLQIPESNFSAALHEAEALGKNLQLSTKATNVTGNYVDLQAQIAAAQTSLSQYELIMTKAQSVGDVLSVQAQINTIQSQIQQLQGQLQLLTSETSYSSLTVQLQQRGTIAVHHMPPHSSGLSRAWHNSVHGFADGVDGLIGIAGPLLFALLCLGVVLVAGRQLWRRWQRHNL